jgi:hypothetical protein
MPINIAILLEKYFYVIESVVPFSLDAPYTYRLDLSNKNTELNQGNVSDTAAFTNYVFPK